MGIASRPPTTPGRPRRREATAARAAVADELIEARLRESRPPDTHLLANRVLDELRSRPYHRTGGPLAERLGVSERTVQRAPAATLGTGPRQAARRIRMQQTAQAIATSGDEELAGVAVQLGYADQAHLISDFRAATGTTPGAYRRELRRLAAP